MSSIHRSPRTTAYGNDYFVNIATIDTTNGDLYNEAGAAITIADLSASQAAGTVLVKDMGKTVEVTGAQYRKVALVSTGTTFYIKLVPASGSACLFARMTLQA